KEKWLTGVVTKVCGGGFYDVLYVDGEEELGVTKDIIRLLSRSSAIERPGDRARFLAGWSVEVNAQGKGMWFPAVVVGDNSDGT
ncbi:hypothetical protein B484DRAFT_302936, partial [Ochromonadaceae sp. CCMP2298]